jgi:hypothetical protein
MTSGVWSNDRIWSITMRSISAAGTYLMGQAPVPRFMTLWLM